MDKHKNPTLEDVLEEAQTYIHEPESLDMIKRAGLFAMEKHEGQMRKSGDPYFCHLSNVAYILATLRVGPHTISAGFLHDTIEDCGVTKEELTELFDAEIAELVEAVTKIGSLEYRGKDDPEYQAANHRKLFIAMARDVRVIIVKLADRLHNMRTLQYQKESSQKRIAAETLDVYAPIAHRIGISAIKNELEDLAFLYLDREEYYHIAHLVEAKKAERDEAVNHMIREISEILDQNHIRFRIFGRSKHLYSIHKKMVKKHKRFDEILDLLAIRIVTETELNCYEILGYIHAQYRPIPGRLKDYIAVPKSNMYQSLHTTIIGDDGKIFEVQIRTEDMDAIAERGIAAHWRYKEGKKYDARAEQKEIEDKLSWFKEFTVYTEEDSGDATASEYMETLQKDIFDANVYVMTPMGRVIDLPSGATPIDFAYRIHTDVGHTAVGAIVNDAMVPLNTELHTGDVVQIKTMKGTGPSEDWLKIVKTNQARNKIKNYLAKKEQERKATFTEEGEKMLSDELRKRDLDPKEYMDQKKIESVYGSFHVSNYTDFMYGIANKHISVSTAVDRLTNTNKATEDEVISQMVSRNDARHKQPSKTGIIVPGIDSMKMTIAACCNPVYGDEIVGYITKGEGVKVHRKDCPNIKRMRSRLIDVQWDTQEQERTYSANVVVEAKDRNFLLTDIMTVVSQYKAPTTSISAVLDEEKLITTVNMTVQIHDIDQLNVVLANLRKIESVIDVRRVNA